MRIASWLLSCPLLFGFACAQDPEAELPEGPPLRYVDAFPAQEGFDRPRDPRPEMID